MMYDIMFDRYYV